MSDCEGPKITPRMYDGMKDAYEVRPCPELPNFPTAEQLPANSIFTKAKAIGRLLIERIRG